MGVRATLATGAGRFVSWGLRTVARRNASQLPGRIGLAIDTNLIADLAPKLREGSLVICGTNGKTTTTNLVAATLEAMGKRVLCNRFGANMAAGVAAALLPTSSADWAVIEADELSSIRIVSQLHPRYLVLLNLFRDQLDRSGEIDHVQDTLVRALATSPETELLVCGDDPLSMGVALRAQRAGTRVHTFGIDEDLGVPPDRVPEARFCQLCGAELTYNYRSYAQLGSFACPNCDFARPQLDFVASDVSVGQKGVSFQVSGPGIDVGSHISATFGGTYMVYNLLAALSAASYAGAHVAAFQRTLDSYHPENGRLQRFDVAGREVLLNLAKNPTGFNQNISLMLADDRPKATYLVINDDFNDGKDISWIWDVDFERLAQSDVKVIAGGHRANDVQVRLKYAGIDAIIAENVATALNQIADLPTDYPLYALTNYSALWPAKAELERMGESR